MVTAEARAREEERIRAAYDRRSETELDDRYALHRPESIHIRSMQLEQLSRALADEGLLPLRDRRILEVGCGNGQWLIDLESMGADREKLAGIDLDPERLERARRRLCPGADLRMGNASELPWPDGSFDVVFQSTVFTSILDLGLKRAVAREMSRVLAPSGVIVWYDFHIDNPLNKDVRGVGRREIGALFPDYRRRLRRVTLAPPVGRKIASVSRELAVLLERIKVFNTHYMGTFRRT